LAFKFLFSHPFVHRFVVVVFSSAFGGGFCPPFCSAFGGKEKLLVIIRTRFYESFFENILLNWKNVVLL